VGLCRFLKNRKFLHQTMTATVMMMTMMTMMMTVMMKMMMKIWSNYYLLLRLPMMTTTMMMMRIKILFYASHGPQIEIELSSSERKKERNQYLPLRIELNIGMSRNCCIPLMLPRHRKEDVDIVKSWGRTEKCGTSYTLSTWHYTRGTQQQQ